MLRLNVARIQLEEALEEIGDLTAAGTLSAIQNRALADRIEELEDMHEEVRRTQAEFERRVAMNDPRAFEDFFARINPEHAAQLFQDAVRHNLNEQQLNDYIATFSGMDESAAAATLQVMMDTEINLVARILENLSRSKRSAIMAEFTPAHAARVSIVMAPDSIR
jgi:flagellar motility protein MotE (MotC chaperone)